MVSFLLIKVSFVSDKVGVAMVFLPAYSPELNPCELVFAQLKSNLRKIPYRRGPLLDLIMEIAPRISMDNLINYYAKCIRPKVVLPELRIEIDQ